jgi:hypothetical protein
MPGLRVLSCEGRIDLTRQQGSFVPPRWWQGARKQAQSSESVLTASTSVGGDDRLGISWVLCPQSGLLSGL